MYENGILTSTTLMAIYVQGLTAGATVETLTAQATGYNDDTATVTVNPSGFIFSTSGVSTRTFSNNSNVLVRTAVLDPATFAPGIARFSRG